jgi:hypothetical protein
MNFNNQLLLAPSFFTHIISGVMLLVATIILYKNYYLIKNIDNYRLIIIILIFSIATGIHGLSHLGMETVYGYYPFKVIYY